ncbi:MAG: hypothetical protein AB7S69_14425 [Salinivirgaceae bacterium]
MYSINVNFQEGKKEERPDDCSLNLDVLKAKDLSLVPNIGDHVSFEEGEVYKVIDRLFEFNYKQNSDILSSIYINIKVTKQPSGTRELLINE